MDAIEFLRQEHRKAKAAFEELLAAGPAQREEKWKALKPELKAHEKIEGSACTGRSPATARLTPSCPSGCRTDTRTRSTRSKGSSRKPRASIPGIGAGWPPWSDQDRARESHQAGRAGHLPAHRQDLGPDAPRGGRAGDAPEQGGEGRPPISTSQRRDLYRQSGRMTRHGTSRTEARGRSTREGRASRRSAPAGRAPRPGRRRHPGPARSAHAIA